MKGCYLASNLSPLDPNAIIVRRTAAIGDSLCSTIINAKLAEKGVTSVFQSHVSTHCVIRRVPCVFDVQTPNGFAHVNLDGAYENDPAKRRKHFHTMFMERANLQLRHFGIDLGGTFNCRPRMRVDRNERAAMRSQFAPYPKPWIAICPRSDSYTTRQVPDGIWEAAAQKMNGTKFWIGRHPGPASCVDLSCRHFDTVIAALSAVDLLVTVDTGPMHVAAAMQIPIVVIGQSSSPDLHLNDQNDYISISPPLPCLGCMENICPKNQWAPPCQIVSPEIIALTVNERLSGSGKVSAIVPIYQPKIEVLNRCLEAVLPQVDEVIVTAEARSVVPEASLRHPKIHYVRTTKSGIGFSGNANFGARHSIGDWLVFLNDDCFLKPDAVLRMREAARGDTGIVSNLLRYPDGTIYHAGKIRNNGVRGWGHIDYKHHNPTFSDVTEVENVCGCCLMTRRSVFYDVGGFDEELPMFAQDDAYCLGVRRAGWKILFTPFSEGIHIEHQSVNKIGNVMDLVKTANGAFSRKWGKYLEHNLNRTPFGNFDYV